MSSAQYHRDPERAKALRRESYAKSSEQRAARKISSKAWRDANPGRNAALCAATYERTGKEARRLDRAKWKKANREKVRAGDKARKEKDPVSFLAKRRAYLKANPEVVRAGEAARRARLKGAEGHYTGKEIARLLKLQKGKCAEPTCQASLRSGYHADHIMPLALGGSNWIRNIQLLCPACNQRKSAKHPVEFAQELGRLL